MRLLLDIHVLIWLVEGNEDLSNAAKLAIEADDNSLYLSIASLWEITSKISLGKLDLGVALERVINDYVIPGGIEILPIHLNHLSVLRNLPLHHRDPFDRLLIPQAQAEGLTVVSRDRLFGNYPVQTLW
jgi:PIN domain nuclease of toxin-antitoxin system